MAVAESKKDIITKNDLSGLRVAIVHYWLTSWRGGEKVIESILKLFQDVDIYTLFYDESNCKQHLGARQVYASSLNNPIFRKHYQKIFPLYPAGIKSLRLRKKYDLIISSESGPAKGISNPDRIPHLCYVHSPMRYCWGFTQTYLESLPGWSRRIAKWRFKKLADWDLKTVDNVDLYVANSKNVANRVEKYYNKKAKVCYPPIDLNLFENEVRESCKDYYLSFGALTPYKNIQLLIETFNKSGKKLVVIGSGSERKKLEGIANSNISFLGQLPEADVIEYARNARALLFPGEEDFGMIPLEVMSQGVPVIAFKKGGALETVVEDSQKPEESTGAFFKEASVECLLKAIDRFESMENRFNPIWIKNHARSFGEDYFHEEFTRQVLTLLNRSV